MENHTPNPRSTRLHPTNALHWDLLGQAYSRWANFDGQDGNSPIPHLQSALCALDQAVNLDSRVLPPLIHRAQVYVKMGEEQYAHQRDPRDFFSKALEDVDRAKRINPEMGEIWYLSGRAILGTIRQEVLTGKYEPDHFDTLFDALNRAITLSPKRALSWKTRGDAYLLHASCKINRGEKRRVLLEQAMVDFDKAEELEPNLSKVIAPLREFVLRQIREH